MEEIIKLLLLLFIPIFFSVFEGTYSYCCYLFWKYAKIDEYYNKFLYKSFSKKRKRMWKENPSEKELKRILETNNRYKKEEEMSKLFDIREFCLVIRRLKSKEEKEYYYPKDRPQRERFDFFMFLSKMNIIVTTILLGFILIFKIFNIFPYNILKNITLIKAILIDGFCILRCIPFGFFSLRKTGEHHWDD